jgi:hypothetical protein
MEEGEQPLILLKDDDEVFESLAGTAFVMLAVGFFMGAVAAIASVALFRMVIDTWSYLFG